MIMLETLPDILIYNILYSPSYSTPNIINYIPNRRTILAELITLIYYDVQ